MSDDRRLLIILAVIATIAVAMIAAMNMKAAAKRAEVSKVNR